MCKVCRLTVFVLVIAYGGTALAQCDCEELFCSPDYQPCADTEVMSLNETVVTLTASLASMTAERDALTTELATRTTELTAMTAERDASVAEVATILGESGLAREVGTVERIPHVTPCWSDPSRLCRSWRDRYTCPTGNFLRKYHSGSRDSLMTGNPETEWTISVGHRDYVYCVR